MTKREIQVPVYSAIRWMVWDEDGPLRGFSSLAEAKEFVGNRDFKIVPVPKKSITITVEDAPF